MVHSHQLKLCLIFASSIDHSCQVDESDECTRIEFQCLPRIDSVRWVRVYDA